MCDWRRACRYGGSDRFGAAWRKTLLMHERPVLGGNASSEIRMWVCGARGNRESGIIEEILLDNLHRNTNANYSIWDSVLYEKVRFQENLTLLLNCSCFDAECDNNSIKSVRGYQQTTQNFHLIKAKFFADCSGDSILAPLTGAEFRVGREGRSEFDESIAPIESDRKTMGMSCLLQLRETRHKQEFTPPKWATYYASKAALPHRIRDYFELENFWWIELGGENDSIADTEEIRDELLKNAFGVWDLLKNRNPTGQYDNWILDWIGFLPGKRESRRYIGDHIVTQNDIETEGRFEDIVAYGGWTMDDHHPGGIRTRQKPTIHHPAPSSYGIPYRALYSKNIENLFFAGRNISVTHSALSSTRVMATCALLGQAVGTAAALAVKYNLSPRGIYRGKIGELQKSLQDDDCYLPWRRRQIGKLCAEAKLTSSGGDPTLLRSGIDRRLGGELNGWECRTGDYVEYDFGKLRQIREIRLIFDSDLERVGLNAISNYPLKSRIFKTPESLIDSFSLSAFGTKEKWEEIANVTNNYQRLCKIELKIEAVKLRLTINKTRGDRRKKRLVFAFEPI